MNFNTANDRASVFAKSEKSKRWNLIEQKFEKMASSRQTPLELQRYIWGVKKLVLQWECFCATFVPLELELNQGVDCSGDLGQSLLWTT